MKLLQHEDIQRWFTLTIDLETGFPCLVVADEVLTKWPGAHHPKIIEAVRKNLGLGERDFPFQEEPKAGAFGFGDSLKKVSAQDGQSVYRLELPIIHRLTVNKCRECKGKKTGEHGRCHYCSGSGKESMIVWEQAFALSASVSLFANVLWLSQEIDLAQPTEKRQLLNLNLQVDRGPHGGSLWGEFSPYFVNFLKTHGEDASFEKVNEMMIRVYRYMWQSKNSEPRNFDYEKHQFRAWQNLPGNLILDIPGDACGIHPSPYVHEIPENEGSEWTYHNVDSPLQQLTLLTGLAAMCDLVG